MTMNNLAMSGSSASAPADEYPFAGVAVAAHDAPYRRHVVAAR
jgi:hypothetical protein